MGAQGNSGNQNKFNAEGEQLVHTLESVETYSINHGLEENTEIIVPEGGKSIVIHGITISTDQEGENIILVGNGATEILTFYTAKTQLFLSTQMHLKLGVDETVLLSCPEFAHVIINYHEEKKKKKIIF